jgi:glycosyltransferase involved in cell wall biosynthesis
VAGYNICKSLVALGHEVPFDDDTAPVQLSFVQPEYYGFYDHQYKIGYTPWESTELPEMWLEHMEQCDEVWATSDWVADVYKKAGVTKPLYIYEHGVDEIWTPKKRKRRDKLRFLHIGEPAPRKSGQMVLDAFVELFGHSKDVELIMKAHNINTTRVYDKYGSIICTPDKLPNVKLISREFSTEEMLSLYHTSHVLIYPSWGEGFGFIPAQAIATGMPTISTTVWAPYRDYVRDLGISSIPVYSPWQAMHPGNVYMPEEDSLREQMLKAYNEFERLSDDFYDQAETFRAEYNWLNRTEKAFAHIVEKFS